MARHKRGGRKKRTKRRQLTPVERNRRKHQSDIRTAFVNAGFEHIRTRKQTITVAGRVGEIDGLFVYENIVVCVEDTQSARQSEILDHLRKKVDYYRHLDSNKREFLAVLRSQFPRFRARSGRPTGYAWTEYRVIHVYSSREAVDKTYKSRYRDVCRFLDYPYLQYFLSVSRTIHKTARFELLKFLGVALADIGAQRSGSESTTYDALLLPETASSFPAGHRLLSFLVDPEMLLERSYVLRSDSWVDSDCLYQRLLLKNKIKSMRCYLVEERRVFVNNIIATLPSGCEIRDTRGRPIDDEVVTKIVPVRISIPRAFNSIGIIDGQHRLYSYHEGNDKLDKKIAPMRKRQHLLLTGILYPAEISELKKQKFEAQLFLEINDKQKRVKGDLKQAIERIVRPYSAIAIAKAVVQELAESGPFTGKLEVHFYDTGKIKTTSIVSYGMRHIVGLEAENSLFKRWRHPQKAKTRGNRDVLRAYVKYCATQINVLVNAFKEALPPEMWSADRKTSRVLTTTTVNGLVFCMRRLIEHNALGSFESYRRAFKRMKIDFSPESFAYKSSHWKSLGEDIFEQCFK